MRKSVLAVLVVAGCAHGGASGGGAAVAPPPAVPEALRLGGGAVVLAANATGVQIYECKAKKDDAAQFEWAFKAPEATLLDGAGKTIGKHYAGPSWEALDGTKVVGALKAKADAPDAGAIPWLLLDVKSAEGPGPLAKATAIHRVSTVGGKAPAAGCTAADAGKEARVPYQAAYYFYSAP